MQSDNQVVKIYSLANQQGATALLAILGVALLGSFAALSLHTSIMKSLAMSNNYYQTTSSFYASEGCVQEAFLQLRTNASYVPPYDINHQLSVGPSSCYMKIIPNDIEPTNGTINSYGKNNDKIRNVVAVYQGAGPMVSTDYSEIFFVNDKSGSMADDSYCVENRSLNKNLCLSNNYTWLEQPMTDVKNAAIALIDKLDANYNYLGLVSYSTAASLDNSLTNDYQSVKNNINSLSADGFTNIGDGIDLATKDLLLNSQFSSRYIILLSDGEANRPLYTSSSYDDAPSWVTSGNTSSWPINYALWKAQLAAAENIVIYTISLGSQTNRDLMENIAVQSGGKHFYAPDSSQLQSIYDEIMNQITKYNLKLNSWQED